MSKESQEFYKHHLAYNELDLDKPCPLTHKGVYHIMDAYHQSRVNAISDDEIKNYINQFDNSAKFYYGKEAIKFKKDAIEWFKNKLLKQ